MINQIYFIRTKTLRKTMLKNKKIKIGDGEAN